MYYKNICYFKIWKEVMEIQDGNCLHCQIHLLSGQSCSMSSVSELCGCAAEMGALACLFQEPPIIYLVSCSC